MTMTTSNPLLKPVYIFGPVRFDFWTAMTLLVIAVLFVLLILPIASVFFVSFLDEDTGAFTLANYVEVFTRNYYVKGLRNTLTVGLLGTLGACLIGVPLAFFTARFRIRGKALISTLAILVLVAPPFIGAYAWIMMLGANGFITNFFKGLGLNLPTIYGAHGIILVFTLKFFPFVFLMTKTALGSVNKSFEDAAENLGCNALQRFFHVTLPLVFPAVSTGAIICFVLSIADFGTPAILGRGFRTLSTIAYSAYTSELGGKPTMAVTVSLVMMAISILALFIQRRFLSKRRYASALTNRPVIQQLKGWRNWGAHAFCYAVVITAMFPTLVVVYTSILETNGPVFTGEYGLSSYRRVLLDAPEAIFNSFRFSLIAVAVIAVFSGLISYLIVRRENAVSGTIDVLMMVPYLVPGVVMAIGFVTTFRSGWYDLTGTGLIIVMILFIRRLPYGVRSTTTNLRQIKPSLEEAAVNLGASPLRAFVSVTVPLILPGLIVGSLMSFITAINELSSTLILYNSKTVTMPVKIYISVLDGEFGLAAALSTILLVCSGLCVYAVFLLADDRESSFV
ncbi:iron(III) transport system permease protein [Labrenzia sp. EL_208]|uniref:Inner membrane ABC transporter permease protein YdcU n=2 Tax=cellular organisms TaxID=131567 RepID=A0A0M6ZR54_9HYPH|nr:iron ABC transporter permease [Roseibium album]MBG6144793.1 iron(III) transport system permease protein [Labrenzia sp. EL_142]MBG6156995.1 iron(III) transport system permease protein [Labrenzia sp. EL_162]MBG6172243.1 iron(III) transport system permease protein [Labrenzia sp. EL_132]MBG6195064.1 iron(III) transport system permease protein [Labrenzia sp. EL_159]MBG6203355.1 iron(III) transport system permease protein [Labrenzia sp. EL_13]MBG6227539.1 iron(III) transport system permease prot